MSGTLWILVILVILVVLVAVVVTAVVARRTPRGSGGAPGEIVADRPLTRDTGSSLDTGRHHAGPAEDRPGDPGQEAMDPEEIAGARDERSGE